MTESAPMPLDQWPEGHTGYIALLGRPNTGKSTLVNSVLQFHLAAVSAKPQTTRTSCLGVYTDDDSQILFLDAPGVHRPEHALDEAMDRAILRALEDADIVLCLIDATREHGDEDAMVTERARAAGKNLVGVVNKGDIASAEQIRAAESFLRERLGDGIPLHDIAATDPTSLQELLLALKQMLPVGPFLHPVDTLTDVYERDIGAELIRAALLECLRQEVPHCMAVVVDEWKERDDRVAVQATLFVEREQHKHIVIGRRGSMIKTITRTAAPKLEALCERRVRLKLWVKVAKDWRRRKAFLRDLRLSQ